MAEFEQLLQQWIYPILICLFWRAHAIREMAQRRHIFSAMLQQGSNPSLSFGRYATIPQSFDLFLKP